MGSYVAVAQLDLGVCVTNTYVTLNGEMARRDVYSSTACTIDRNIRDLEDGQIFQTIGAVILPV